jgi:ABC-2 type transport system permease protein
MSKFWVIAKREYAQVVKKKSFVIGIFLTPAIMAAFMILPAWLMSSQTAVGEKIVILDESGTGMGETLAQSLEKYKDPDTEEPRYLVQDVINIPPGDSSRFNKLNDSLRSAINEKSLKYALVIKPSPALADTNLYLITNSDNFQSINRIEQSLTDIISATRLEMSNVNLPVDSVLTLTKQVNLPLRDTKGESIPFVVKYFAALIFIMLMYMMIITYGTTLMRSVIEEKNSRIMEVLVSSVSPFQLMLGKVIGLGMAAFTQVAVWVVLGLGIFFFSGAMALEIDPSLSRMVFNPVIVVFFVLLFVSGYIMYSTIFALIGSIVNSDKEAQNFIFPVTIMLIAPVIVGSAVIQDPYISWAVVMSYIPFFAPTMMLQRITFIAPTATHYSLFSGIVGEAILSFLVIVASTLVIIWITGRIFRVGILMYGKRPTFPELVRWVKY